MLYPESKTAVRRKKRITRVAKNSTRAAAIMADPMKENLEFYKKWRGTEEAKRLNGEILLIKDRKLIDHYKDVISAYRAAKEEHFTPGTFMIRRCSVHPKKELIPAILSYKL